MRVFIGSLNSQTGARARYRERSFGSFSAHIRVTCRLNEPDETEPWANAEADNVRRMYFLADVSRLRATRAARANSRRADDWRMNFSHFDPGQVVALGR